MLNSKAQPKCTERPGLGDVVEFESTHWKGAIFGKLNAIYFNMSEKPIEYWVDHIDYADFKPNQLIRIVECAGHAASALPKPKFKKGDVVKYFDGERHLLLVIRTGQCRVDEEGAKWVYYPEPTDALGNKVGWDDDMDEEDIVEWV